MGAADRARARLVDGLRDGVLRNAAGRGVLRDAAGRGVLRDAAGRGVLRNAAGRGGRLPDPAVEKAFRDVPRHLFLPGVPLARAYADEAVPVQTVGGVTTSSASQPSMMAIMLGQLDLRPGHRVLEIGAGTGYNAALMARLVGPEGWVVAVDIDPGLVDGAARHLAAAGTEGVELVCGDGALGHPSAAPYDRIVLTVGSGDVRPEWVAQLAPGGRLLLPLAVRGTQLSVALDLGPDGVLRSASVHRCAFVRLRGVGAVAERGVAVDGLGVLPADDGGVHREAVGAALADPGGARPVPLRLGPGDLWDGFGLWLALAEPGTCRLVVPRRDPDDLVDAGSAVARLRLGPGGATVGLVVEGSAGPGVAALVLDVTSGDASRGPWPARVQAFGPEGEAAADRVVAACRTWAAAGRPTSEDLHLTVVPHGSTAPPSPDATVVDKEHCRVLVVVGPPQGGERRS